MDPTSYYCYFALLVTSDRVYLPTLILFESPRRQMVVSTPSEKEARFTTV